MYTAETLNADKKFSHEDAKLHPQAAFELSLPICKISERLVQPTRSYVK